MHARPHLQWSGDLLGNLLLLMVGDQVVMLNLLSQAGGYSMLERSPVKLPLVLP
jgi:hypothetical protein